MAKIDVFNLKREKVGELELADEVFATRSQRAALLRGREGAARLAPPGTAARQGAQRGRGLDEEDLQAEGHGPRASRLDPRADVRRRRSGAPAAPARLELPSAAPGAHRRAPERAVEVRARRAASSSSTSFELDEIKTKGLLARARARSRRQEGRWSSTARTTRTSSSRSATAAITSSCRPKASTSTTSSATTRSIVSKDAAKALEARCLRTEAASMAEPDANPSSAARSS